MTGEPDQKIAQVRALVGQEVRVDYSAPSRDGSGFALEGSVAGMLQWSDGYYRVDEDGNRVRFPEHADVIATIKGTLIVVVV